MGKYRYNRYHDVEISAEILPCNDPAEFAAGLEAEEHKWERRFGRLRGVEAAVMWIRVPTVLSHVLPWLLGQKGAPESLVRRPFVTHHATTAHVMVVRGWRVGGRPNIPLYGTHYARVECVVVEDGTGRILAVHERIGVQSAAPKLVTGSVNSGENISAAAVREVREETGIRARFVRLVGCGNRLRTRFDRDEILFGVLMSAEAGQRPRADRTEILQAEWQAPDKLLSYCSPMTKEWMIAAASGGACMGFGTLPDFRGPSHTMEFHAPNK